MVGSSYIPEEVEAVLTRKLPFNLQKLLMEHLSEFDGVNLMTCCLSLKDLEGLVATPQNKVPLNESDLPGLFVAEAYMDRTPKYKRYFVGHVAEEVLKKFSISKPDVLNASGRKLYLLQLINRNNDDAAHHMFASHWKGV